jgi:hypothetical protein
MKKNVQVNKNLLKKTGIPPKINFQLSTKLHNDKVIKNKIDYDRKRNELIKSHKGKYVAFSNNEVKHFCDSLFEACCYHDIDPSALIVKVGHENEESTIDWSNL